MCLLFKLQKRTTFFIGTCCCHARYIATGSIKLGILYKNIYDCSIEDRVRQMELRIMALVEESCMLSSRPDHDDDSGATKKEYDLGQVL